MPQRLRLPKYIFSKLRFKVTLGVILPIFIVLGLFGIVEHRRSQEIVLDHLTELSSRSGRVIENSLRNAMLKSDFSSVQVVLDSVSTSEDFRVVYLLDINGEIIFGPRNENVGTRLRNTEPGCVPCHRLDPKLRPGSVIATAEDGQRVFRSMYPIENAKECNACHNPDQRIIGLLLTDIPVAPIEQALNADYLENIYWWLGMILTTAIMANLTIDQLVIRRVRTLALALQDFGKGMYNLRLHFPGSDEISMLGNSFNEMSARIEIEENENHKLSNEIQVQNALRGLLLQRLITAQEDERKRVARELHDDIGQSLTALSFQVQALERWIKPDPENAVQQINLINNLIVETTEKMYELTMALRPSALDDLGLVAAVRNLAERFLEGSDIKFHLDVTDFCCRLAPDMETALYRVIQEALSNTRRHARAKKLRITLSHNNGVFKGEIEDDGIGFNPESVGGQADSPRGLGIEGIKERITQYDGQVEFVSEPGKGTKIIITFPATEVKCD